MTEPWDVLKLLERVERLQRDTRYRVLLARYSVATSRHVLDRAAPVGTGLVGVMPGSTVRGLALPER